LEKELNFSQTQKKTQVPVLHWQQNPTTQKLMKTITKKSNKTNFSTVKNKLKTKNNTEIGKKKRTWPQTSSQISSVFFEL